MIYGDPGTIIPLNIAASAGDFQLSVPPSLTVARRVATPGFQAVSASWRFDGSAPVVPSSGDAFAAARCRSG